jgi:hypothetical protein
MSHGAYLLNPLGLARPRKQEMFGSARLNENTHNAVTRSPRTKGD